MVYLHTALIAFQVKYSTITHVYQLALQDTIATHHRLAHACNVLTLAKTALLSLYACLVLIGIYMVQPASFNALLDTIKITLI